MNIPRRIPIDTCARPVLAGSAALLGIALLSSWRLLQVTLVVLISFLAFFFRDPERHSPTNPRAFVSPADGVVTGVHLNDQPEAGPLDGLAGNESNWTYFHSNRYHFVVRQIAGKAARRVVCRLRVGDSVRKGQRMGIIKLGSRTDLYLPVGCQVQVRSGDRVYGGSSILAVMPETGNGPHS
jgi:phosphatidylserine decarboxylase